MRVLRHRCSICGRKTRAVTLVVTGPSETIAGSNVSWVCDRHADLDDHQTAASVLIMWRDLDEWRSRGYGLASQAEQE